MAAKEFIVAIELGSSKVTGVAGRKNSDGSISILAVAKEDSSSFIRKGTVYKITQTEKCISDIVAKLKAKLKQDIAQVYVGIGGQSIHSVNNNIVENFYETTGVTSLIVNRMMDRNRNASYPDQSIINSVPQEYLVNNSLELDPEGIQCQKLEGNFLNILCRDKFYTSFHSCFKDAKVNIAETYLSPLALADSILTDNEKSSGCVMVDLGAGTTTVAVYYKNILRHLAVIPLGGNNITKDIASLKIDEDKAEEMKLKYANAFTEESEIDETLSYPIDMERQVKSTDFIKIVEGRLQEIIENVRYQIPNEYLDKLLGGIILTGGGSNMKNIEKAFRKFMSINKNAYISKETSIEKDTSIDKVRVANFVTQKIVSKDADINAHDGMMNTVLGILAKGDMNCAGSEVPEQQDIFEANVTTPVKPVEETSQQDATRSELKPGVVPPPAEPEKDVEKPKKKNKQTVGSSFKKLKNFLNGLIKEED